MAKRFKLHPIKGIDDTSIKIPTADSDGEFLRNKDNSLVFHAANLIDLLNLLIRAFPRERLNMENITHATRLRTQIIESEKRADECLVVEEAEHDWVKKMIVDDSVGPKIFGMDTLKVKDSIEDFEKLHEPKEEGDAVGS